MIGDFAYCNPTRIHFGKNAMDALAAELASCGAVVQLVYGGGSIKRNGVYDQVIAALAAAGKTVVEDAGVMPNPTIEKLREGVAIAREHDVDFILAVGGGSCADYAKALSVSINLPEDEDPWDVYYARFEEPACEIVPVGVVLTMAGTGSEMNGGAVITNRKAGLKIGHVFGPEAFPRFAIMNPEFTYTVPEYQMVSGIFDVMSHICEQYFSGDDDSTSDYAAEGLMRSLIAASQAAVADPRDYEARSNIMWTATWALNTFIAKGKTTDWEVHMLGQAVGALTDAAHGMTLSAVALPYYRLIMPYGLPKFVRFATAVWDVDPAGKTDVQVAEEGLAAMESWMREIGCAMSIAEFGCDESMLEPLADATLVMKGGYHELTRDEIIGVFRESLHGNASFVAVDADAAARSAHEAAMPFPVGEPNDAYAQYFVGRSYLAPVSSDQVNVCNVTFEPGCRNNWHIHRADAGGGQILVCVAGHGYYQEWGKAAIEMGPGDCVNIPAGVKHWHGAAPDSWFSHLAIEVPGTGTSNEWLEPVDDAQYALLK